MAEIKLPPKRIEIGETFYGDPDAVIFTRLHSHSDILRYVMSDQGVDTTRQLVDLIAKEDFPNG